MSARPTSAQLGRVAGRVAVLVTEQERDRLTELGPATWVTIERADGRRMCWSEVHDTYTAHYPGRWAVQVFPPVDRTLNTAHRYHLWVLDHEPAGLDIGRTT